MTHLHVAGLEGRTWYACGLKYDPITGIVGREGEPQVPARPNATVLPGQVTCTECKASRLYETTNRWGVR